MLVNEGMELLLTHELFLTAFSSSTWACSHLILSHWLRQITSAFSHAPSSRNSPGLARTPFLSVTYAVSQKHRKQPTSLPGLHKLWEILWGCSSLSHLRHATWTCLSLPHDAENKGWSRCQDLFGFSVGKRKWILLWDLAPVNASQFQARVERENKGPTIHILSCLSSDYPFLLSRFHRITKYRKILIPSIMAFQFHCLTF